MNKDQAKKAEQFRILTGKFIHETNDFIAIQNEQPFTIEQLQKTHDLGFRFVDTNGMMTVFQKPKGMIIAEAIDPQDVADRLQRIKKSHH